jgi:malonyl-CoA/methylmalonyl-CoA synthetase
MTSAHPTACSPAPQGNFFAALRAAFPADLDATAIRCEDSSGPPHYSWRDVEGASAKLANLLASLELPAGSRIAVQLSASAEALLLYLAVLRAGHVYVPDVALGGNDEAATLSRIIQQEQVAVVVCAGAHFGQISKLAFLAGARYVFTLNEDRSGSLLDRAAQMSDQHEVAHRAADDLAAIIHTSSGIRRLSHADLMGRTPGLPNSACPRCGQPFQCGAAQGRCDCFELKLDAALQTRLSQDFGDCLCLRCLRELQAASGRISPA